MSRSYSRSHNQGGQLMLSTARLHRTAARRGEQEQADRQPSLTGLPSTVWQIGNAAMGRLLDSQGDGRSLAPHTLAEMEQRFGEDFRGVRLHDAPTVAGALNARAFVQGENIYLGANAPALDGSEGKSLVAHELAHVVQQRRAGGVNDQQVSQPGDRFEQAADQAAQQAMQGNPVTASATGSPPGIQCEGKDAGSSLFSLPGLKMRLDNLANFALNQSKLPPEHQPRITSIALQISKFMGGIPGGKVIIVGHTDTTGPEKHNLNLGEQRAEAVRKELAIALLTVGTPPPKPALSTPKAGSTPAFHSLGATLPEMQVESTGESDLAETTKDETPSPANRRVEIFYQGPALTYKPDLSAVKPDSSSAPPAPSGGGNSKTPLPTGPKIPSVGAAKDPLDSIGEKVHDALPKILRDKVSKDDIKKGIKKGGEEGVMKILEQLIPDDSSVNKNALLNAARAAIRQFIFGEKWTLPIPPLHEMPPSSAPPMPKAPGEVLPSINLFEF